jgi:hypothetical protein
MKMYMEASEFAREVDKLKVYPNHFRESDAEKLAYVRLILARFRLRYPDNIARRIYFESRTPKATTVGVLEPDGTRWEIACELHHSLHKYDNYIVYGRSPHPFVSNDGRFKEFVKSATDLPFETKRSLSIDVSHEAQTGIWDSSHVKFYYSSWQVLLAAETAQSGLHCMLNWHDDAITSEMMHKALKDGKLPDVPIVKSMEFAHELKEFEKLVPVLDAVTTFGEKCDIEYFLVHKSKSGRFLQTEEESVLLHALHKRIATECAADFAVGEDNLIPLIRYLMERWLNWNRRSNELVCNAYKQQLARTIEFAKLVLNLEFSAIKEVVEVNGVHRISILDEIWPDWLVAKRKKTLATLKVSLKEFGQIDEKVLNDFADFISDNGLESFFWQLNSFEEHALRGNNFRDSGMHSAIQGMAIVVEHVARCLTKSVEGASVRGKDDLLVHYKVIFKRTAAVVNMLKNNIVIGIARKKLETLEDWKALLGHLQKLRSGDSDSAIVADLVAARCVRGAAHYKFPNAGHFEMEGLFVALMRAAFFCFIENKKTNPDVIQ